MFARFSLWRGLLGGLIYLLAPSALAAPADQATTPKVTVLPSFAGTPTTQIARSSQTVSYALAIANDNRAELKLQLVVQPFRHNRGEPCGAGAANCTLSWKLNGAAVAPGKPLPFTIAGLGDAELLVEGKAKALGFYDSSFVVAPDAADSKMASIRHSVRLVRNNASLGTDPILWGPGGVRTKSLTGAVSDLHLTIVNGSDDLVVRPSIRAQLLKDDGSSNFVTDAGWKQSECSPNSNPPELSASERMDCTISVPWGLGAGRYRLDASLSGPGITTSEKSREFTVRDHWAYAFAILLVGALGGGWFAGWQNSGRRRAIQLADALDLKEPYQQLARAVPDDNQHPSRKIIDKFNAALAQMADQLRGRSDADFAAELTDLAARLPRLERLARLEQAFVAAKEPAGARAAFDAALFALSARPLTDQADARLDAFEGAVAANAPANMRTSVGSSPGQIAVTLTGATADALDRLVRRVDFILLFIAMLLVSAIGVVTLWQTNSSWGSLGDYLVALFTGFAATSAGTLGLLQLTSGYVLGRIGTAR